MGLAENVQENTWNSFDGTYPLALDLTEVIEPIQEVLQKINVILNVTLEILEFVKAFVTSLLDPILALVEQIIELLRSLLDLSKIGIYTAGDWNLIGQNNFAALKGGYLGYQNRMIKRWLKQDPNRPDFKSSGVLGIYLYGGTDFIEGVEPIIKTIDLILSLFRTPIKKETLPSVTNLEVEVLALSEIQTLFDGEQHVRLSFNMTPKNKPIGIIPNVGGFVVQMSTFEDGLLAGYSEPTNPIAKVDGKTIKTQNLYTIEGGTKLHRVYSEKLSKMFPTNDNEDYTGEGDNRRTQFLLRNPLDIYRYDSLTDIAESGAHLFFETVGLTLSEGTQTIDIPFSQLPEGIDISSSGEISIANNKRVSFRVMAVSKEQRDQIKKSVDNAPTFATAQNPIYNFPLSVVPAEKDKTQLVMRIGNEEKGFLPTFSPFVTSDTITEIATMQVLEKTIRVALSLCVLFEFGRNNAIYDKYEPTFIELEKMFFETTSYLRVKSALQQEPPQKFRWVFASMIDIVTKRLLRKTPSAFLPLLTKFEELSELSDEATSWMRNPNSTDGWFNYFGDVWFESNPTRVLEESLLLEYHNTDLLSIFEYANIKNVGTSAGKPYDSSKLAIERRIIAYPFVYLPPNKQRTFTNLQTVDTWRNNIGISETLAFEFLTLLLGTDTETLSDSEWIAWRPFAEGLEDFDKFIKNSIKFFEAVSESLEGFGEKIIKAIELIEMRIQQIQSLIALIDRVLETLKNLEIELSLPLSALVHIGTGNQEMIQNLITAQEKPDDNAASYTIGAVIVTGGIPTILLELLASLFVNNEE